VTAQEKSRDARDESFVIPTDGAIESKPENPRVQAKLDQLKAMRERLQAEPKPDAIV